MMAKPSYRRARLFVDPAYQLGFFLKLLGTIVAVGAISAFLAVAISTRNLSRPGLAEQPLLQGALIGIILALFINLILAIPIAYYLGLRQSHRVIGPLGRIIKRLEAIGRGEVTNGFTLRRGDVLRALETAINQMTRDLARRFRPPS